MSHHHSMSGNATLSNPQNSFTIHAQLATGGTSLNATGCFVYRTVTGATSNVNTTVTSNVSSYWAAILGFMPAR